MVLKGNVLIKKVAQVTTIFVSSGRFPQDGSFQCQIGLKELLALSIPGIL